MVFASFLTDGHTAERQSVYVALGSQQLRLFDEQGMLIDEWSYDGLRFVDLLYQGQPVRLSLCDRSEGCLTVEDQRFLPLLGVVVPRLRARQRIRRHTTSRLLCWGMTVAITVLVLLWEVPRLAGSIARTVPVQWEEILGHRIIENFVQHSPVCHNTAGQAALQSLATRLVANAPVQIPFNVQVRKANIINAFALPGGYIVLFNGFVRAARSPEEVAGVLAHEMAHQIQRHPLRGIVRSLGLRLVSGAVMGGFSLPAASGAHFGEMLFSLSYNRGDEIEADRVGVAMLNNVNIRGDGLIDFFTRYQTEGEENASRPKGESSTQAHLMSFLSTHPPGQERIAAIRSLVRGKHDALTKDQWKALQDICEEKPEAE